MIRLTPDPMSDNIPSVQPGGGACYRIELAWGRLRRWHLRTFRRGYVQKMATKRKGDCPDCPHHVLDPRDLKYVRNRCGYYWDDADDPFRWREKIPFARWGLAELQLFGWPLLAMTVALAFTPVWFLAVVPLLVLLEIVYFFRDPPRRVPQEAGLIVSPADGKVVEITHLEHDEFVGGPAVRIGIFLSIFNVHINRSPLEARCISLRYTPGKYLNALNPRSAIENEAMWIGLEEAAAPHRRIVVRQIAGAIARRIVCAARPGELLARGEKFGMIKLGSRTELILPVKEQLKEQLIVDAKVGDHVKAGTSILARYKTTTNPTV